MGEGHNGCAVGGTGHMYISTCTLCTVDKKNNCRKAFRLREWC